ncbi:MAG: DUF4856 domain-containing protein [Salibacteraceae bacterium]
MKAHRILYSLLFASAIVSVSCNRNNPDDDDALPTPLVIPATYSFENVSYSGQTERLNQTEELSAYVKTAHQDGVELDLQVMKAMFENTDDNGNGHFTFSSTKQLKDKCFEPDQALIETYFKDAVTASQSTEPGSNGVAGRILSEDGTESRLYDANGFEPAQLIEKTIMGAVFYYQATSVYLGADKMNVDNDSIVDGEGTEMQHHWDEAYGYFGATTDFPANTEDVRFWAKYCVGRDALIGSNDKLSEALIRGRASLVADRMDKRNEAIEDVRAEWELVCAATAIHYLNGGVSNLANDYDRNHELSEAYAFVYGLKYNEGKVISNAQIDEVLALIGDNLYEVSSENLTAARDQLAEIYDLTDVKSLL